VEYDPEPPEAVVEKETSWPMSAPVRLAAGTLTDGTPKTLKVSDAVPPTASVAVKVYGPGGIPVGMVYVQEYAPDVELVPWQAVIVPQTSVMWLSDANPPAENVTVEPAVAPAGAAFRNVTTNVAVAVFEEWSTAVKV
jgi:hypothetical protein